MELWKGIALLNDDAHNAADAALRWLNGAPATMTDHSSTSTSPCLLLLVMNVAVLEKAACKAV
jgi:hypothetical protein